MFCPLACAVEKTLQRFSGWVTSQPTSPTAKPDVRAVAREILKPVAQVRFERRRVAIDQGAKLIASVAHVVAMGAGAIAAIWHDRGEDDHGYDARPEHLKRSGKLFLVRDSWAAKEGLIKKIPGVQYTDEVEQPAELPFCSCSYEYVTVPHDLPEEMLTAKGRMWVRGQEYRADSTVAQMVTEISQAQRHAGNYPKEHRRIAGLDVSIETAAGATRTGIGADGEPWYVQMPADYGYIRRTEGADGEQLDCYIGPNPQAPMVWLIRQQNPDTKAFDEEKAMIGFDSRSEAIATYCRGFSDGRGQYRIQSVQELSASAFRIYALASA